MARFVLKFSKGEEVRWLGHLDLLRAFERVIRRTGVPVAYTQGFNPRVKMTFASALGCGVTGSQEILTIEMAEDIEPVELAKRLNSQMPDGLKVLEVEQLNDGSPKSIKINGSEFLVELGCEGGVNEKDLQSAVEKLLLQEEIPVVREKKGTNPINIRPAVESLRVEGPFSLVMRLAHGQSFTPKPAEVVQALTEHLPGLKLERVHRVKLY